MVSFAFYGGDHIVMMRLRLLPNKHFLESGSAPEYSCAALTYSNSRLKHMIRKIEMNENTDKALIAKMCDQIQSSLVSAVGIAENEMKIGLMNRIINNGLSDSVFDRIGTLFWQQGLVIGINKFSMVILVNHKGVVQLLFQSFSKCRFPAMRFTDCNNHQSLHHGVLVAALFFWERKRSSMTRWLLTSSGTS